ncbi:MAG: hypothetical protein AAF902_06500 [Chloroflexota bacterium]
MTIGLFMAGVNWGSLLLYAQNESLIYLPVIMDAREPEPPTLSEVFISLTNEEKYAAILAVEQATNSIIPYDAPTDTRDLDQELFDVGDALANVPNIYATLISTETLSADVIFADGTTLQVINNRPDQGVTSDQVERLPDLNDARANNLPLPNSGKAVVAAFDGGEAEADYIRQKLIAKGYAIVPADASIDSMTSQYKDLAVLYLDTHGTSFAVYDVIPNLDDLEKGSLEPVRSSYGIQTSTEIDLDGLAAYGAEFRSGEITLSIVAGNRVKISVTEPFIQKHWSFKDGVAVMHVCNLGLDDFVAARKVKVSNVIDLGIDVKVPVPVTLKTKPVRDAILNAGAQTLLTFDDITVTTFAFPSIEYFFDGLLGIDGVVENDEAIPYTVSTVVKGMEANNLMEYTFPLLNSRILDFVKIRIEQKEDARLAPSLETIQVQDTESAGMLELRGEFGPEQGKVTIGGTDVTVKSWTGDKIVVETPTSGAGWIGEVVVLSSQNIRSNPVDLREWSGTIDITFDPKRGDLFAESKIDVVFRGIVHSYREFITDEDLKTVAPAAYFSTESVGTVSAKGESTDLGITERWSGLSFMRLLDPTIIDVFENEPLPTRELSTMANNENVYGGKVYFLPEEDKVELCLFVRGFYVAEFPVENVPMPIQLNYIFGVPFQSADGTVTYQESAEFLRGSLACYTTDLLPNMDIEAGLFFGEVEESEYAVQWSKLATKTQP